MDTYAGTRVENLMKLRIKFSIVSEGTGIGYLLERGRVTVLQSEMRTGISYELIDSEMESVIEF